MMRAPAPRMRATAAAFAAAGACAASQSGLPPPVREPAMSYMSLTAALRPASGPSFDPITGAFKSCGTKAERERTADMRAPAAIQSKRAYMYSAPFDCFIHVETLLSLAFHPL